MRSRLFNLFLWHNLPMIITVVLLGLGTVSITVRFLGKEQQHSVEYKLKSIQSLYSTVLDEVDTLNLIFSTNPDIVNRLKNTLESDSWTLQENRDIRGQVDFISAPAHARAYIDSIYIYQENSKNRLLSSSGGVISIDTLDDQNWITSYSKTPVDVPFWSELRMIMPVTIRSGKEPVITIYRSIYNTIGRRTGVIVLNLLVDKLVSFYDDADQIEGEAITISNERGDTLFQMGDLSLFGTRRRVSFSRSLDRYNWTITLDLSLKELNKLAYTLVLFHSVLICLSLILGLVVATRAHRKERRFILQTLDLIEKAKTGKVVPENTLPQKGLFDYMTRNILQTFLEQDYLKMRKEAMEYRALQMQINPHFLFNTLETINWRAVKLLEGSNDISTMITQMSRILKYAVDMGNGSRVPVKEEILNCGYYLNLQKIRFPGQFSVNWSIEEDLEMVAVPRLVFQPLLENSFNYGFKSDGSPLEISIGGVRTGNRVTLRVEDNGCGMDKSHNGYLTVKPDGEFDSEHIGIQNVIKRLYLFYKGDVTLFLETAPGRGTRFEFCVPLTLPEDV